MSCFGRRIRQVAERLERKASPADRANLLTATYVLTGLRVRARLQNSFFRGYKQSAIQAIDNLEKLEQLTERLLTASSWQELLRDV